MTRTWRGRGREHYVYGLPDCGPLGCGVDGYRGCPSVDLPAERMLAAATAPPPSADAGLVVIAPPAGATGRAR